MMDSDPVLPVITSAAGPSEIVLSGVEMAAALEPGELISDSAKCTVSSATALISENAVLVDANQGLLLSADGLTFSGRITTTADLQNAGSLLVACGHDSIVDSTGTFTVTNSSVGGVQVCSPLVDGATVLRFASHPHLLGVAHKELRSRLTGIVDHSKLNPMKKKGGWPKGRRRKQPSEVTVPRAPLTGYVLFAMDRRQEIKDLDPELQFTEVTKILGSEWSNMAISKKKKFLDEADEDKKRYMEELKSFHNSDIYQSVIKKKKFNGVDLNGDDTVDAYSALLELEHEASQLYCRLCNQYFTSLHNKKEHLFGRQHLLTITGELEKELQSQSAASEHPSLTEGFDNNVTALGDFRTALDQPSPVDVDSFITNFLQKHLERDAEISMLHKHLKHYQEQNITLCKQVQEYKDLETKLEQEMNQLKSYSASLSAQIDGLKMVPMLFGMIRYNETPRGIIVMVADTYPT